MFFDNSKTNKSISQATQSLSKPMCALAHKKTMIELKSHKNKSIGVGRSAKGANRIVKQDGIEINQNTHSDKPCIKVDVALNVYESIYKWKNYCYHAVEKHSIEATLDKSRLNANILRSSCAYECCRSVPTGDEKRGLLT